MQISYCVEIYVWFFKTEPDFKLSTFLFCVSILRSHIEDLKLTYFTGIHDLLYWHPWPT